MSRWSRRLVAGAVLGAVLVQGSVLSVLASQGVALDQGRITVETTLKPGQRYGLGRITVRNPGTERTRYELRVTAISTPHHTPDSAWFSFSPAQVTLAPGRRQAVNVTLRLPREVAPGRYEALVGAQVASGEDGMALAAAAAARLTFTVGSTPPDLLQVWWLLPSSLAVGGVLVIGRRKHDHSKGG
jgi:hypothetical protein